MYVMCICRKIYLSQKHITYQWVKHFNIYASVSQGVGYLCPKLSALGGVIMEINVSLWGGSVALRYLPRGKIVNHFLGELFVWGTYYFLIKILRVGADVWLNAKVWRFALHCTICGVSAVFVIWAG